MELKKSFITGIVFLLLSAGAFYISEHAYNPEKDKDARALCRNSISIEGKLQNEFEYTEGLNLGNFKYTFDVDGKTYSNEFVTSADAELKKTKKIWYEPDNPGRNSNTNPCVEVESLSKNTFKVNSFMFFVGGVLFAIMGLKLIGRTIRKKFFKENGILR